MIKKFDEFVNENINEGFISNIFNTLNLIKISKKIDEFSKQIDINDINNEKIEYMLDGVTKIINSSLMSKNTKKNILKTFYDAFKEKLDDLNISYDNTIINKFNFSF